MTATLDVMDRPEPRVRLEPFAERHLAAVAGLIEDPSALHFSGVPEPPSPDFPRRWLARYETARSKGSGEAFAALDDDGRFVGLALAPAIDREGGEVELGYIVAAAARGRGYGTAVLRALTAWAFEHAGALRIVLIIDVENPVSERVAERCGYTREGVMRSIHHKQGKRIDASLWSRLPSD
jgi:RimJ/RimL family protein N-acetyltransferase